LRTDEKPNITVGVVGFPNVGKSSLINALKKSKATAVNPQPGTTKAMQEVAIERNIIALDSPGVIPNMTEEIDNLVLR
jgi:nuclear GTP-binding protein